MKIDKKFIDTVLDETINIQQIASPTFNEKKRAEYVANSFLNNALKNVTVDSLNNVISYRPGGSGRSILISAHLDTVFPIETDLTVKKENGRIYGPGIGDNSLGVASLIGLQKILNKLNINLPGNLYIVANSCEEGLGDLKGIREVISKIGNQVSAVIALEGSGYDRLTYSGIGSLRYKVSIKSPGGHSWGNFGNESAIHQLVKLASKLTELNVPVIPKTTFNIGTIQGGASVNTIAENASFLLDLRSESKTDLDNLVKQVEAIFNSYESKYSSISYDVVGDRPVGKLNSNDPLVKIAKKTYADFGISNPDVSPSSTDINLPLSLGYPSICIGLTKANNVHKESEYIEIEQFYEGFRRLVQLIINIFE
ncbi:MAG: M20/M25/M40 family metallo-hydrolase [bacterium]|nr:M20/M25/M40 family metallo-hydrolase [bacterium]